MVVVKICFGVWFANWADINNSCQIPYGCEWECINTGEFIGLIRLKMQKIHSAKFAFNTFALHATASSILNVQYWVQWSFSYVCIMHQGNIRHATKTGQTENWISCRPTFFAWKICFTDHNIKHLMQTGVILYKIHWSYWFLLLSNFKRKYKKLDIYHYLCA